jgi:hypothetical protein
VGVGDELVAGVGETTTGVAAATGVDLACTTW